MTQTNLKSKDREEATTLRLIRHFAAPREMVFAAFTELEQFQQWWGPKSMSCPVAEIDARPGGRFYAEMSGPEGNTHIIEGRFKQVTPPSKLVFTWAWQHGDYKDLETLVTLEFHERDGGTELVLTHEQLADEHARDLHGQGWASSFDCLGELVDRGAA